MMLKSKTSFSVVGATINEKSKNTFLKIMYSEEVHVIGLHERRMPEAARPNLILLTI
jgi:hypothetical protein